MKELKIAVKIWTDLYSHSSEGFKPCIRSDINATEQDIWLLDKHEEICFCPADFDGVQTVEFEIFCN